MGQVEETIVAAIPARWGSTRFPGKALAVLGGEPMIAHVIRRAQEAATVSEVLVATDDERILEAATSCGAAAVMTPECASGTDRIAAALQSRDDWDLVVNLQGDEPLLASENIDTLVTGMLHDPSVPMGTLCRPLSRELVEDPSAVKVVRTRSSRALYFSRSVIPYPRRGDDAAALWRLHLGIYAFRKHALGLFVSFGESPLEKAEALEQLRALENGMEILVLDAPHESWGVDTVEDLHRAEQELRRREKG